MRIGDGVYPAFLHLTGELEQTFQPVVFVRGIEEHEINVQAVEERLEQLARSDGYFKFGVRLFERAQGVRQHGDIPHRRNAHNQYMSEQTICLLHKAPD